MTIDRVGKNSTEENGKVRRNSASVRIPTVRQNSGHTFEFDLRAGQAHASVVNCTLNLNLLLANALLTGAAVGF